MRSIRHIYALLEGVSLFAVVLFAVFLVMLLQKEIKLQYIKSQGFEIIRIGKTVEDFIGDNERVFKRYLEMDDKPGAGTLLTEFSDIYFCTPGFRIAGVIKKSPGSNVFPGYDLSASRVSDLLRKLTPVRPAGTALFRSPESDRLSVYIGSMYGGGFMVGRIGLDNVEDGLRRVAGYTDSIIVIASRDGYILSSSRQVFPIHILPENPDSEISLADGDYLYTRRYSDALQADLAIFTPMSSAYSILRTIARYHLLFIVIFSIIILSKIAWQSKYIIGPLGTFSSRIARWNVTTRPPELPEGLLGYEEISELYRSFEEKSRQIADAVAALRNSEELFRQLAENIRDVFWVYNLNKQAIEYISPGYEEIWGRRRDDLYLKPESFMENVYPEDAEKIMEAKGLLLKGSFSSVQFRILRPDGSFRWIWARTYPVADGNGKFFRMTGIAEDITGRKLAESLLSIQRDLGIALSSCANLDDALQVIIDSVLRMEGIDAGGIYLVGDADGSIELACSSGLSDDFAALVRHYDGNSRNARIIMEGNPVYFEFSEQAAERTGIIGQEINLPEGIKSLAVLPIRHMGASIACLNAASKTYPAIPSSSRDSLEAIASLLGSTIVRIKTQEQIHSSLREKEVLLKEVHHRVKNNFQIIMSLLNLQSRNIKDDAQLRYFYELRNRITAMALIHEKLYQSGNFASINFPAYILSLSTELRRIYHDPGREVEFKMEADDIDISLDQAIPCSLIMNEILSNALKYAFPPTFENNARITVTIRRAGEGEVELSVSDNGVGIPGHIEPRNTATLGISLIDVLSSQINGNVHIDSSTEGTRFTIRFTPK